MIAVERARRQLSDLGLSQTAALLANRLETATLSRIWFAEARITDLARYSDTEFDMVIGVDAPVSHVFPRHNQVLCDLVRVARRAVVVSVAGKLGTLPYSCNPAHKRQYLVEQDEDDPILEWYPAPAREMWESWWPDFKRQKRFLETGLLEDPDAVYDGAWWNALACHVLLSSGELAQVLQQAGLRDVRLAGPGALSRSIPLPILKKLLFTPTLPPQFLEMCYEFDSHPSVCGMGKDTLVVLGVKG